MKSDKLVVNAYHNRLLSPVIDDRSAKRCAGVFGISVLGTISLLIRAKRMRYVTRIKPLLSDLQSTGFRITNDVVLTALQLADEE